MPIVLPPTIQTQAEAPQPAKPFAWLLSLTVSRGSAGVPPVILRITDWHTSLQWPRPDPAWSAPEQAAWAAAWTFWPLPFRFSPFEQNQEGDLPASELAIDNTTRVLMRYLHAGRGLEGNPCTIYMVAQDGLTLAMPNHERREWKLQVQSVHATSEAVVLRIASPNWFDARKPAERYVPNRCRWRFGSSECGYVINSVAAFTTCNKTVPDCTERGEDHRVRGLPVVHPANFGGHLGLQRARL